MQVQTANSAIARAAAKTLNNLPTNGAAEARIEAAQGAVDQFLEEHGASTEVSGLRLGNYLANTKVRPVTRENLLRAGLEFTAQGAGNSGAPLAAAALQMSTLGWNDSEKNQLLQTGYGQVSQHDLAANAHPFSKDIRKAGNVSAQKAMLGILASDKPGTLHDQAGTVLRSLPKRSTETTADLGEDFLNDLAQANPENEAYQLADETIGNFFLTRLPEEDVAALTKSLFQPGVPNLNDGVKRIGEALPKMHKWQRAAERVVEFAESRSDQIDAQKGAFAVELADEFASYEMERADEASRITGKMLENYGQRDSQGRHMIAALASSFNSVNEIANNSTMSEALTLAESAMPSEQWKTALRVSKSDLRTRTGTWNHENLVRTFQALEKMPAGADPVIVTTMTSKISNRFPSSHSRNKARQAPHDLATLESYFELEGSLKNDIYTERALEHLMTDAQAPEVRAFAKSMDEKRRTLSRQERNNSSGPG